MTTEIFVNTVMKLRDILDRGCKAGEVLGMQFTEGATGEMLDLFYDLLIPGANDAILEDFGVLLFGEDVPENEVEDFYEMYKESLD